MLEKLTRVVIGYLIVSFLQQNFLWDKETTTGFVIALLAFHIELSLENPFSKPKSGIDKYKK
jgi:hypothetical protein